MSAFSSNDGAVIERDVDAKEDVPFARVWSKKKLDEVIAFNTENDLKRICLQFPDDLIQHSVAICTELQERQPDREFFVLADTTYCPCCVDEVGAEHIQADGLVHFGPACLTRPHNEGLKIRYMFTEDPLNCAQFQEQFACTFPDRNAKITIFYTINLAHELEGIRTAVREYPNAIIATLAIGRPPDLLHWNTQGVDFQDHACLYIGQDDQCFFNLNVTVAAQSWYLYDHVTACLKEATLAGSSWLRRRMFFIEKCKDAQIMGIVHGTVSSQGHLDISNRIQSLAKAHAIRPILISVGKLNPAKLANFMEIDCFVLIGCPQNNLYTSRDFYKPLISVFECELALNPLWKDKLPQTYSIDFNEMLPNGKHFTDVSDTASRIDPNDISLITGNVRGQGNRPTLELNSNGELIPVAAGRVVAEKTAADALRERTWRGLEQSLGQDNVGDIQQGRSGLAIRYGEAGGND